MLESNTLKLTITSFVKRWPINNWMCVSSSLKINLADIFTKSLFSTLLEFVRNKLTLSLARVSCQDITRLVDMTKIS
jgi:hypothetical protein